MSKKLNLNLNELAASMEIAADQIRTLDDAESVWHARFLQEQKDHRDNVRVLNVDIRDLEASLSARNAALLGWQEVAAAREKQVNHLLNEIVTHQEVIAQAQKDKTAAQEEFFAMQLHVGDLRDSLNAAEARCDQALKDLSAMSYHNNTLQGKYDEAVKDRDSWAQRLVALDDDMRGTMTTLRGLEKEVADYKKTDAYLRAQLDLKTKAVERIGDLFEKRGDELDELDSKVLRLESENDDYKNTDTILRKDIAHAYGQCIEMGEKMRAFEAVIAHLTQKGDK